MYSNCISYPRSTVEGSAKRNIVRRRVGGGGKHKGNSNKGSIDDGSTYEDAEYIDENDPNYDSEEEIGNEYIPSASPPRNDYHTSRAEFAKPTPISLQQYKLKIENFLEVNVYFYDKIVEFN